MTTKTFLLISNVSISDLKDFLTNIIHSESTSTADVYTLQNTAEQSYTCSIGFNLKNAISTFEKENKLPDTANYALIELDRTKPQTNALLSQNSINDLKQHFVCAYLFQNKSAKELKAINLAQEKSVSLKQEKEIEMTEKEKKSDGCFATALCCFSGLFKKSKPAYQQQVDEEHNALHSFEKK